MNLKFLFSHKLAKIALAYYLVVVIWWIKIKFSGHEIGLENYLFNLSYIFFNLSGGITGLIIARKKWGGFKSSIGRCLSFLSLGLLGQGFGLLIWTFYNVVLKVEIPYPSIADIGYFSLIPFYTLAMFNLAKASGVRFALKSLSGKLFTILIPLLILSLSYFLFIKNVGIDASNIIKTFLDLSYPAGEALSVSLGLVTYILSIKLLGGKMKSRIIFILAALSFQYLTEFTFLYTSGAGLYYNAGFVDLMYATSYLLMALSLFSFHNIDD